MNDEWLTEGDLAPMGPRKVLEKNIENRVCAYAKKRGWRAMKFVSPAYRSVPDRIFFKAPGRAFFIEFKKPGKKPTPKQTLECQRLIDEGFDVFVIDSVEDGMHVIDLMG